MGKSLQRAILDGDINGTWEGVSYVNGVPQAREGSFKHSTPPVDDGFFTQQPGLATAAVGKSLYRLAKCRCPVCNRLHDDIVDFNKKPNKHGWIRQLCDSHLEAKIGQYQFALYTQYKNAILAKLRTPQPKSLPVQE